MVSDNPHPLTDSWELLRECWLPRLQRHRAIAVIRTDSLALSCQLAEIAIEGGMEIIEITWNSAQPGETLTHLRQRFPHCTIGVGTVLTPADLQGAIAGGCQFCFTPHYDPPLISQALAAGVPIIPGTFSPTEIVQAWQKGATAIKVFPIQALGGAAYIRTLQRPLGTIPLIPTGGIALDHVIPLLQAGAIAVGLSSQLFPSHWIETENWSALRHHIAQFVATLAPYQIPASPKPSPLPLSGDAPL